MLTIEILRRAAPQANAALWVPILNVAMARWGIAEKRDREIDFLAHALHESAQLSRLVENLSYSADGLANTWPARFAVKDTDGIYQKNERGRNIPTQLALSIQRNPEAIANRVYCDRLGNGPIESGDAWRYIGHGIFQVTGKSNHQTCGTALALDLVAHPELLEQPVHAANSAGWYWRTHNCNALSDGGDPDFTLTTRAINGGLIGLAERVEYRRKLREVWA